ncbi:MAG: Sec-independent protein translocase protein TatB [Sphingobium sp.]
MFDIGSTELLLIVIVAVVVIGPKDLPRALYKVGQIVGKARGMARHFRTGVDAMVREVELEELEKKWADQNRRIMAEHPPETAQPQLQDGQRQDGKDARMEQLPAPTHPASGPQQDNMAPDAADGPPYIATQPAPGGSADRSA